MKTTRFFLAVIAVSLLTSALTLAQPMTDPQKRAQAEKVKTACARAWSGYKQYAWGYDALQPITKKGHNWYGTSLLMTPVDAFDTFVLLGLKREAKESKDVILTKLNFNGSK